MGDEPDNLSDNEDAPQRMRAGLFSKKKNEKTNKKPNEDTAEVVAEVVMAVDTAIGKPLENRFYRKSKGLIICNAFEGTNAPLVGYKKDVVNLTETFKDLNISFDVERDLTAANMKSTVHYWLKQTDFENADCSICFILSHGDDSGLLYGADSRKIRLEDIKTKFVNHKDLYGKPKLFFLQACRGLKDAEAVDVAIAAAGAVVPKAKDADVFQFFSTSPGKVAWVNAKDGSWFINNLCDVLRAYGGKYHLGDIVTKVNERLAYNVNKIFEHGGYTTAVEVSEAHSTLTQNIFFNDGTDQWL